MPMMTDCVEITNLFFSISSLASTPPSSLDSSTPFWALVVKSPSARRPSTPWCLTTTPVPTWPCRPLWPSSPASSRSYQAFSIWVRVDVKIYSNDRRWLTENERWLPQPRVVRADGSNRVKLLIIYFLSFRPKCCWNTHSSLSEEECIRTY